MTVTSPWLALRDAAHEKIDRTVEDGTYTITLIRAEPALTSTEKPKFDLEWEIIGGAHGGNTFRTSLVVSTNSEDAMDFFFARMAILGAPIECFTAEIEPEDICKRIVSGQMYEADVRHRSFKGRDFIELTSLEKVS